MKEQNYIFSLNWKITVKTHSELLWDNKQIIRLKPEFYDRFNIQINKWNVCLFNAFNSLNDDIINNFKINKENYNKAIVVKIIWYEWNEPIMDYNSIINVEINKMDNLSLNSITTKQIEQSLIDTNKYKIDLDNLLLWLTKNFYSWNIDKEKIINDNLLFVREVSEIYIKDY